MNLWSFDLCLWLLWRIFFTSEGLFCCKCDLFFFWLTGKLLVVWKWCLGRGKLGKSSFIFFSCVIFFLLFMIIKIRFFEISFIKKNCQFFSGNSFIVLRCCRRCYEIIAVKLSLLVFKKKVWSESWPFNRSVCEICWVDALKNLYCLVFYFLRCLPYRQQKHVFHVSFGT